MTKPNPSVLSLSKDDHAQTTNTSRMRYHVDAWDPGYGSSDDLSLDPSTANLVVDVERPAEQWQPIQAGNGDLPAAVVFVDGVRRIDAQLWLEHIDDPGTVDLGLAASYAAGAVCCCTAGAHLVRTLPRRAVFTAAAKAQPISTSAGSYELVHTSPDPGRPPAQVLSQSVQNRLADLELIAASEARQELGEHCPGSADGNDLLVVDGPLRGRERLPRALGYIKSHHSTYLPPELNALVARLPPGQRTPVFRIGTTWDRHTWYLRLPGRPGAPWAGIVRVEASADLPAEHVVALAGLSQQVLPGYASAAYKDPRAPQNLYPIAGLERELKHRLGAQRLLERALRSASGSG